MRYRSAMQLNATSPQAPFRVTRYTADSVTVADQTVTHSAILTPTQWLPWSIHSITDLTPASFAPFLTLKVSVLLLATDGQARWTEPALFAHAAAHGIGMEVMTLGAAARTYNLLASDDRAVALAWILPRR